MCFCVHFFVNQDDFRNNLHKFVPKQYLECFWLHFFVNSNDFMNDWHTNLFRTNFWMAFSTFLHKSKRFLWTNCIEIWSEWILSVSSKWFNSMIKLAWFTLKFVQNKSFLMFLHKFNWFYGWFTQKYVLNEFWMCFCVHLFINPHDFINYLHKNLFWMNLRCISTYISS